MISSYDLCGPDPTPVECDEVTAIKELTRMLPINPVVINIGAERGISTLAILEERPDVSIFSVDIGICEGETNNIIAAGLDRGRVVRILGRSQDVDTSDFPKVDMVFVDGDHSYLGVKGDILNWFHLIKPGGIAAFHDYIPEPIPAHIHGRAAYAIDEWRNSFSTEKCQFIMQVRRLIAFRVYP